MRSPPTNSYCSPKLAVIFVVTERLTMNLFLNVHLAPQLRNTFLEIFIWTTISFDYLG